MRKSVVTSPTVMCFFFLLLFKTLYIVSNKCCWELSAPCTGNRMMYVGLRRDKLECGNE